MGMLEKEGSGVGSCCAASVITAKELASEGVAADWIRIARREYTACGSAEGKAHIER